MRRFVLVALAAMFATLSFHTGTAIAHPPEDIGQPPVTRSDLEAAKFKLKLFRKIEYPLQFRELNSEIRIMESEARMLKDRIWDYERFPRSVFPVTLQNAHWRLMRTQHDLKLARHQRILMQIRAQEQVKRQKRDIERAELQLAAGQQQDAGT